MQDIFKRVCKKAGIQKHLTLYSLRHARITQVSEVLSVPELKEFAGHSKASRVAENTYIHVNEENIKKKLWKERGIEVKEEEKTYFKLKRVMTLRKLLEALSRVLREQHHCGAINCDLVLGGFINTRTEKGEIPQYKEDHFALVRIIEEDKLVLETDYKRFAEYLHKSFVG